jgi:hypothetical protein
MVTFSHCLPFSILGRSYPTKIIRSSSQCGWPLRNIHVTNDYGSFHFYVDFFSFFITDKTFIGLWLYMWVTRWVFYKNKQSLTLRRQLGSPPVFCGVRIVHLFSFLRCDLFVFVRCLVCPNITSVFVFAIFIAPFILQIKI